MVKTMKIKIILFQALTVLASSVVTEMSRFFHAAYTIFFCKDKFCRCYENQWDCLHRLSEESCADPEMWRID